MQNIQLAIFTTENLITILWRKWSVFKLGNCSDKHLENVIDEIGEEIKNRNSVN